MFKENYSRENYARRQKETDILKDKYDKESEKFESERGQSVGQFWLDRNAKEDNTKTGEIKFFLRDFMGIGQEDFERLRESYFKSRNKLEKLMDSGHSEAIKLNNQFDKLTSELKRTEEYLVQIPEASPKRNSAVEEYGKLLEKLRIFEEENLGTNVGIDDELAGAEVQDEKTSQEEIDKAREDLKKMA